MHKKAFQIKHDVYSFLFHHASFLCEIGRGEKTAKKIDKKQ